jgi:hypothetical protein
LKSANSLGGFIPLCELASDSQAGSANKQQIATRSAWNGGLSALHGDHEAFPVTLRNTLEDLPAIKVTLLYC